MSAENLEKILQNTTSKAIATRSREFRRGPVSIGQVRSRIQLSDAQFFCGTIRVYDKNVYNMLIVFCLLGV